MIMSLIEAVLLSNDVDPGTERLVEPVPVQESEPVSVQGRLHEHADVWLNASQFVRDIVTKGYWLPFLRLPWPVFKSNHSSSIQHLESVSSAIRELVSSGCVVSTDSCLTVCSPLSVVSSAKGKLRLVLDLNQFLPERKFKYEGLNLVPLIFKQGEFFFTFDLKSEYYHVDIHPDCWRYLEFSWETGKVCKFYMFRVLPFGLSTACYVFTKLLRLLIKRWRSSGIGAIVTSRSREQCLAHQTVTTMSCTNKLGNEPIAHQE